jgi:hypothetical protein
MTEQLKKKEQAKVSIQEFKDELRERYACNDPIKVVIVVETKEGVKYFTFDNLESLSFIVQKKPVGEKMKEFLKSSAGKVSGFLGLQ